MDFQEFIKPELLILIPVLCFVGAAIKHSNIADKLIPWILGGVSVVMAAIWVFATSDYAGGREIAMAVFTAITQGILVAGASVYANQLYVQSRKAE